MGVVRLSPTGKPGQQHTWCEGLYARCFPVSFEISPHHGAIRSLVQLTVALGAASFAAFAKGAVFDFPDVFPLPFVANEMLTQRKPNRLPTRLGAASFAAFAKGAVFDFALPRCKQESPHLSKPNRFLTRQGSVNPGFRRNELQHKANPERGPEKFVRRQP